MQAIVGIELKALYFVISELNMNKLFNIRLQFDFYKKVEKVNWRQANSLCRVGSYNFQPQRCAFGWKLKIRERVFVAVHCWGNKLFISETNGQSNPCLVSRQKKEIHWRRKKMFLWGFSGVKEKGLLSLGKGTLTAVRNFHFNNWFNLPSQMYWENVFQLYVSVAKSLVHSTKLHQRDRIRPGVGENLLLSNFSLSPEMSHLKIIKRRKLLSRITKISTFSSPKITSFDVGVRMRWERRKRVHSFCRRRKFAGTI